MDFNDEQAVEQLHVFDLPQLYTKPSADVILQTLTLLTSSPPSWQCSDSEDDAEDSIAVARRSRKSTQNRTAPLTVGSEGIPRYLTSIIASDLRWIQDDSVKEMIWEEASLRLSERSGRSAMPAMTRKFQVPSTQGRLEISLYEPAMTADNLGLKTWAASYQLAKRLRCFALPEISKDSWVLELGAGTGLVGIAAAAVRGWRVCLTDLPEIVPNLQHNVDLNIAVMTKAGGEACVGSLDWTNPAQLSLESPRDVNAKDVDALTTMRFPIILVADALYSPDHPRLLASAIKARLSSSLTARVLVELPLRETYTSEREDFRERMGGLGLHILDQGEETGFDDWGWTGEEGSQDEVRCWWSVWGWSKRSER